MTTDHLSSHYTLLLSRILATAAALPCVRCRGCRGGRILHCATQVWRACDTCDGTMTVKPEIARQWWPFPLDPNIPGEVIREFLTDPSTDRDAAQRAAANIAWILTRSPEGITEAAEMLFQWEREVRAGFIYELIAEALAILTACDKSTGR